MENVALTRWQEEKSVYKHVILRPLWQRATEKQLRQMQTGERSLNDTVQQQVVTE